MRKLSGLLTCLSCAAWLQAADFPALYNSDPGDANPPTPQQALKSFKLPPGFEASLFAAEPDVQNPIALAWDTRGRMWVAENYTYAERTKRFDLNLKDRVIILEDQDWDGVAEKRRVFTDDVQMLTSVELGHGGVWLMCPPQLLFIPDANADDVPDGPAQVMLDGFTVAKDNYHNFANGLRWGPDGWLYGRCGHSCPASLGVPGTPEEDRVPMKGGIWRFHPKRQVVEVLTHGTTNPWGHDWDANGEMFFINTVTGHLWHLIHGAHLHDTSPSLNPGVYHRLDTIADHYHFDTQGSWMDSRDGKANDLGGGHAHIGMMIYQAEQWPEIYRNKLFTLNMHGRRANVERLERLGSGYVGRHEPDVFLTDDPWFRGIEISTGPDGSGFILDWSDTGECHESTGVHRTSGRIFRLSYGHPQKPKQAFAWRRPNPKADLHSADEYSRVRALRHLTDHWPLDTLMGPKSGAPYPLDDIAQAWPTLLKLAESDPSSLVHLTLASTLQRLPWERRAELAKSLVRHPHHATDNNLSAMVWYGLIPVGDRDPKALVDVAKVCTWPLLTRWMARHLGRHVERQPDPLRALLEEIPSTSGEAVLRGMSDAFEGWRKAPKPPSWDAFVARVNLHSVSPEQATTIRELAMLFGDGRALDAIKATALNASLELAPRQAALKTLIDARPDDLRQICESLLEMKGLNTLAARGLSGFDDPGIAERLIRSYRHFAPLDRGALIDTLVSRPSWAKAMLDSVAKGKIPRTDISAFHARQIRAHQDKALTTQLTEVWGELRESADDKKQLIEKLKKQLDAATLAKANLSQGRVLFTAICGACHQMYGEGGKVGPDLTGSGRANLDYLLENIADPSGVVSADYRISMITMKDGRVLSGVVAGSTDKTLTLRAMTESQTLDRAEIQQIEASPLSMMPEGLLLAFQPDQVRDLIAYLMHPVQVK